MHIKQALKSPSLLKSLQRFSARRVVAVSGLTVVTGIAVVAFIMAAGAAGFFEPENGSLTGGAKVVTTAGASGGKAVQFGAATPVPTATPTPTPTPTATPPLGSGPAPGGYPTATNRGWQPTGVTLTPWGAVTENITITQDGLVLDSVDIRANLTISAKNVTIKRSRISPTSCTVSQGCFAVDGGDGLVLQDVEVTRANNGVNIDRAVAFPSNATLTRVYIHNVNRGIAPGDNTTIQDSYIDDFNLNPPAGAHTAAVTIRGAKNVTLRHNTIGLPPNGASSGNVSIYDSQDSNAIPSENITLDANYFNGGSACMWDTPGTRHAGTFMTFTNNLFGMKYYPNCGEYYPVYDTDNGPNRTWTNNSWYAPGDAKNGQII